MMTELIAVIISITLVYLIGLPLVNWYSKAKKEMEEQQNDVTD